MNGEIGPGLLLLLVLWILWVASAAVVGAWATFFVGFLALAEWVLATARRIRNIVRSTEARERG